MIKIISVWGDCTPPLYLIKFFRVMGKNSSRLLSAVTKLLSKIHYTEDHMILETMSSAFKPEAGDEHVCHFVVQTAIEEEEM